MPGARSAAEADVHAPPVSSKSTYSFCPRAFFVRLVGWLVKVVACVCASAPLSAFAGVC